MDMEIAKSAGMIVGGVCALAAGITAYYFMGHSVDQMGIMYSFPGSIATVLGGASLIKGASKAYDIWEQYQSAPPAPFLGFDDL